MATWRQLPKSIQALLEVLVVIGPRWTRAQSDAWRLLFDEEVRFWYPVYEPVTVQHNAMPFWEDFEVWLAGQEAAKVKAP